MKDIKIPPEIIRAGETKTNSIYLLPEQLDKEVFYQVEELSNLIKEALEGVFGFNGNLCLNGSRLHAIGILGNNADCVFTCPEAGKLKVNGILLNGAVI